MAETPLQEQLQVLGADSEMVDWASAFTTLDEAWAVCERGDWMLWYLGATTVRAEGAGGSGWRPFVWVACQCARESLQYVRAGDDGPRHAIEKAEAWVRDEPEATDSDVDVAYRTAAAAAYADAADAAAFAAAAATYDTIPGASDADAARRASLRVSAAIVRRYYPTPTTCTLRLTPQVAQ